MGSRAPTDRTDHGDAPRSVCAERDPTPAEPVIDHAMARRLERRSVGREHDQVYFRELGRGGQAKECSRAGDRAGFGRTLSRPAMDFPLVHGGAPAAPGEGASLLRARNGRHVVCADASNCSDFRGVDAFCRARFTRHPALLGRPGPVGRRQGRAHLQCDCRNRRGSDGTARIRLADRAPQRPQLATGVECPAGYRRHLCC